MGDVVDYGGRGRPPQWLWAAVSGLVVAALIWGFLQHLHHGRGAASARSPSPFAVTTPAAISTSSAGQPAWPSAPGACGNTSELPLLESRARIATVDTAVLVGGSEPRQLSPTAPAGIPIKGFPRDGKHFVTTLASGPHGTYALVSSCDYTPGAVYRITGETARPVGVTADELLGGAHHSWAVTYPPRAANQAHNPGAVLTPLDGGQVVRLPLDTSPIADATAGLLVTRVDFLAGRQQALLMVDPRSGSTLRELPLADPLGADRDVTLLSSAGCPIDSTSQCWLIVVDSKRGKVIRDIALPPKSAPNDVTFSPDGRRVGLQLTRAQHDPRFATDHPAPPSDIAVVDLDSGAVHVVPGLELPAKSSAGLSFDATGAWLLATVNEGRSGLLLAWREGMSVPAVVSTIPGPLAWTPPILPLR